MLIRAPRREGIHEDSMVTTVSAITTVIMGMGSPQTRTCKGHGIDPARWSPGDAAVVDEERQDQRDHDAQYRPSQSQQHAFGHEHLAYPERCSPMARRVPISGVRSTTAMLMVLPTVNRTMTPMRMEMNPKIAAKKPMV